MDVAFKAIINENTGSPEPLRIIVAGSRGYDNYENFCKIIGHLTAELGDFKFISGAARTGADRFIIDYAKELGVVCDEYPADWDQFKLGAGYIRNAEMAEVGTHLIVFWDLKSRGTKHMIELARKKGIPVIIVSYRNIAEPHNKV